MTKQQARAQARALRAALDQKALGRAMADALFGLPAWQQAHTVLAFAALPDEPDTEPILRRALAEGKRLLLPRVTGNGTMDWVEIPCLELLQRGAFGIPEPPANLPPVCPPADNGLALIPCLAVSPQGVRLGRGGGYYDRFLSHYRGAAVLVCRERLLRQEIPFDLHDYPVPWVITEAGLFEDGTPARPE